MANWSAEEIRAFKLKDVMNCRMSALKAAATNNEGKGISAAYMMGEATVYFAWLRQDQDVDTKPEPSTSTDLGNTPGTTLGQLPEPTLAQKKVLDAISEKVFDGTITIAVKTKVLNWAEEVYGQRSYPTKLNSVDEFINWYNN